MSAAVQERDFLAFLWRHQLLIKLVWAYRLSPTLHETQLCFHSGQVILNSEFICPLLQMSSKMLSHNACITLVFHTAISSFVLSPKKGSFTIMPSLFVIVGVSWHSRMLLVKSIIARSNLNQRCTSRPRSLLRHLAVGRRGYIANYITGMCVCVNYTYFWSRIHLCNREVVHNWCKLLQLSINWWVCRW